MMISSFTSGLGRFSRTMEGLSHADKAAVFITLLRVTDRRAPSWGLPSPRGRSRADVQLA